MVCQMVCHSGELVADRDGNESKSYAGPRRAYPNETVVNRKLKHLQFDVHRLPLTKKVHVTLHRERRDGVTHGTNGTT